MSPNPQFPADLVTFTEEILNGKLHFFVVSCTFNLYPVLGIKGVTIYLLKPDSSSKKKPIYFNDSP